MIPVEPSQDPTGEPLPGVDTTDPAVVQAFDELKREGWGEGDHEDPHVPADFNYDGDA